MKFRNGLSATNRFNRAKSGALAMGATAMTVAGSAFAQAPDLTAIETEIGLYKVAVVGLVIAFAVVLWAIRAAGLAKPR